MFLFLSSNIAGFYLGHIDNTKIDHTNDAINDVFMRVLVFIATIGTLVLWAFFFSQEYAQLKVAKFDYLNDYWNWIDGVSLICNFLFLITLNIDVMAGS